MVTSVFQGFSDVTIKTIITGYVQRTANWIFNYGSRWPCTSGTKLGVAGLATTIVGGWCDVFSLLGATGQISKNDWGDISAVTSTGNWNPSFNPDNTTVHGMQFDKTGAPIVFNSYAYTITLGANSSFPSVAGTLPAGINPTGAGTGAAATVPAYQRSGSVAWHSRNGICGFNAPLTVNMIDENGTQSGINDSAARSVGGLYPNAANTFPVYATYDNDGSGNRCLAQIRGGGLASTVIPVTWDDPVVDAWLKDTGSAGHGITETTICDAGYISYFRGPATIAGRANINAALLVTSFDGAKWSCIVLSAGDADAVTALSTGLGTARTGQITGGNFVWFQNSLNATIQDKVFGGPLGGGTGVINGPPPINVNCGPKYDPFGWQI